LGFLGDIEADSTALTLRHTSASSQGIARSRKTVWWRLS